MNTEIQTSPVTEHAEAPASAPPARRTALPERWSSWFWRNARKVVVAVIGCTLLAIGVIGLFVPVLQGWLTIFAGLALLATEFAWARWVLKRAREKFNHVVEAAKNGLGAKPERKADPPHS
jgi:sulfite exporter TauE/SafE